MNFQDKLKALIELFEKWLSEPDDNVQIEQWKIAKLLGKIGGIVEGKLPARLCNLWRYFSEFHL